MTTVFKIWSVSNSRPNEVRIEFIDTSKNKLFRENDTAHTIKSKFEAFWGLDVRDARVRVIKVEKVKGVKSQGENWGIKWVKMKNRLISDVYVDESFGGVF